MLNINVIRKSGRKLKMVINKIKSVFANREFLTTNGDKVQLLIGKPRPFPPGEGIDGFFYCPFQIKGCGNDKFFYGSGADSLDAMFGAIRMAVSCLKSSVSLSTLIWKLDDSIQPNLGLPDENFWDFRRP